tara:strand:+ start:122 stop:277 length:156 start_codon:yes stop_codon:yes gene_type:complete
MITKDQIPNFVYRSKENGTISKNITAVSNSEVTATKSVVSNLMTYIIAKHS